VIAFILDLSAQNIILKDTDSISNQCLSIIIFCHIKKMSMGLFHSTNDRITLRRFHKGQDDHFSYSCLISSLKVFLIISDLTKCRKTEV
jgi:hypothetical protein